jgi:hypothetical protein
MDSREMHKVTMKTETVTDRFLNDAIIPLLKAEKTDSFSP